MNPGVLPPGFMRPLHPSPERTSFPRAAYCRSKRPVERGGALRRPEGYRSAMSDRDETRGTRLAANTAACAVVLFGLLCFLTTQAHDLRETLPFTLDPYDAVVSYAVMAIALVAGATWVRSLRHREPVLDPAVARRIRLGVGIALAIMAVTIVSDALAYVAPPAEAGTELPWFVAGLWLVSAVAVVAATVLLVRAVRAGTATASSPATPEPDLLDDALGLGDELAGRIPPLRPLRPLVGRLAAFLEGSGFSPRRHRLAVGVVGAVATAVAFDTWHAIVEGPWVPEGAVVFGLLAATGAIVIYGLTLRPLRLIRPAD